MREVSREAIVRDLSYSVALAPSLIQTAGEL